jgi:radical SAM protein with 4Fe4S-binding SPASM domain
VRTRARHTVNRERFEYIARQASGGGFEQFCLAGEREYILTEQGDVYGCELIGDKLGNVREVGFDFRRIRAGEAAAEFVRAKRERLCRCTHECNARTMILFNRRNAAALVTGMVGARGSAGRD